LYFGTPFGWFLTPSWGFKAYIREFYTPIAQADPNAGHLAIAELQQTFPEKTVHIITMNVDGLHQTAGNPDESVIEVHGTVRRHRCVKNGHPMDLPEGLVIPKQRGAVPETIPVPKCSVAGCGSTPRPDCVLFTEALPSDEWSRAMRAVRDLSLSDVMIVVGTSGVVYPAASLPELAIQRGVPVFEINPESTPLSSHVIFLQGTAGSILSRLLQELKSQSQDNNTTPISQQNDS
jgi:NAD-dependent deacetylase